MFLYGSTTDLYIRAHKEDHWSPLRGWGTGADYGLGNIGTCLGPPPPRGPPTHKKKKKSAIMLKKENGEKCHEWGPKDAGNNDQSCIQFAMKN